MIQIAQAQRVGCGFSVQSPHTEFMVVITNHYSINQQTQVEITEPAQVHYQPSFQFESTNTIPPRQNKRSNTSYLSDFLVHNLSTLLELTSKI